MSRRGETISRQNYVAILARDCFNLSMESLQRPNFLVRHAILLFVGVFAAAPLGFVGEFLHSNAMIYGAIVLAAGSFALLMVGLLFELLTKFQWPLLELLLTVFGGSLSVIYGIRQCDIRANALTAADVAYLVFSLFTGLTVTFLGTFGALEWIRALKIQHALGRIALVLLAWASVVSPIYILVGLGLVFMTFNNGSTIFGAVNRPHWIAAGEYLSAALVFVPVVWVHRRASRARMSI